MNGEARRKLPVWRTVGDSYQATFTNWRYAIRISWAWLPVLVMLATALEFLDYNTAHEEAPGSAVGSYLLAMFPIISAQLLVLSSISVAWQRKLLRDETWTGGNVPIDVEIRGRRCPP